MVSTSSHDTIGRRGRTKPHSTLKRIRLSKRDLLWFAKINTHGPLSSSELHQFSIHLGSNQQRATNRLTDLFNEDNNAHGAPYLSRPHQQFARMDARYQPLIYDLTPASVDALKAQGAYHENNAVSGGPWWHSREVAAFTAQKELETLSNPQINYIPGWRILERAGTTNRFPTTYTDPYTHQRIRKDLIPDALYGLEYVREDGLYYHFWAVEIDRGTVPKTSPNTQRKSLERQRLQYEDWIGNGKYREQLGMTAPMGVVEKGLNKSFFRLEVF